MEIGNKVYAVDDLGVRVSVNIGITVPVKMNNGIVVYLKPSAGIEMSVPPHNDPNAFMDELNIHIMNKLNEYLENITKWSQEIADDRTT